jgi:hypothetical protein
VYSNVQYVQNAARLCTYLVKITEVNNADCEKVEVVVARVVPEHVKVLAGQVGDHRDDWQRHQQSPEHLQGQRVQKVRFKNTEMIGSNTSRAPNICRVKEYKRSGLQTQR